MQDIAQDINAVLRAIIVMFVALLIIVPLIGTLKAGMDWALHALL